MNKPCSIGGFSLSMPSSLVLGLFFLLSLPCNSPGDDLSYDQVSTGVSPPPDGLFSKGGTELSLSLGPGVGMPVLGSRLRHNWVLGVLRYGYMLSDIHGEHHWYRGNWEITADLFGGFQYHPLHAYVVGFGPAVRYNFVTGTRWVPYVSLGAGLTGTDIREGDLSTEFEFNLRGGPGVRYFFRPNLAASFEYQFIHLSNAGISVPNLGVNNSTVLLGLHWFY